MKIRFFFTELVAMAAMFALLTGCGGGGGGSDGGIKGGGEIRTLSISDCVDYYNKSGELIAVSAMLKNISPNRLNVTISPNVIDNAFTTAFMTEKTSEYPAGNSLKISYVLPKNQLVKQELTIRVEHEPYVDNGDTYHTNVGEHITYTSQPGQTILVCIYLTM